MTIDNRHTEDVHKSGGNTLVLTALGIVFGDIGTSPLYALQTVLGIAGGTPTIDSALGLLSLIIWTLLITVSLKYVTFVMRADNGGEGGILALMSLLRQHRHHRPIVIALGLFGAALIYGDGAITPAISVLSAIEGLKTIAPVLTPYVLPVAVIILICLFAFQYQGTSRIGWIFGPVMVVWFFIMSILGIRGIIGNPVVIATLNPWYGVHFLLTSGIKGFLVLGGVFLAVTGAEALYADMGHTGARPIRLAWYGLVLPSLLLNYMGQTALLLVDPHNDNIFFGLCPKPYLFPYVILAAVATVIASQAIISGAFSMTRQAILLGWFPRLQITQTSSAGYGQIYISSVNWILMFITVGLAIMFGSSDRLASAYGIAVSLTMLLTTSLLFITMREIWKWNLAISVLTAGSFFCIDLVFLGSNLAKIMEGGWVPLALAIITYIAFITWRRGSVAMAKKMHYLTVPVSKFVASIEASGIPRVPGTAIFLSKSTEQIPPLIIWHVDHNKALHHNVIALSIVIAQTPWVAEEHRMTFDSLAPNFWRLIGSYGFMERPNIPDLLFKARQAGCKFTLNDITYYVGHETILHCSDGTGMPLWQKAIYSFLQRNSAQVHEYLNLPRESVVEIGRQIEI